MSPVRDFLNELAEAYSVVAVLTVLQGLKVEQKHSIFYLLLVSRYYASHE